MEYAKRATSKDFWNNEQGKACKKNFRNKLSNAPVGKNMNRNTIIEI